MTSRKPIVLLMRPGIGWARNSCELQIELAVHYTVMFCAIAHSFETEHAASLCLSQATIGLMLPEASQVKTDCTTRNI